MERGGETHKSYTTILDLIRLYRGVVRPFGVRGVCRCEGCELGVCRVCDPYESCGSLQALWESQLLILYSSKICIMNPFGFQDKDKGVVSLKES